MTVVTDTRGYLNMVTEMRRKHGRRLDGLAYVGPEDLVLKEGRDFESVPWTSWRGRGYRRMKVKNCFGNAFHHVLVHDELTYVEGYATSGLGFAIHHGWAVTEDGRVVDPTWREDEEVKGSVREWEYVGVPFDTDWVCKLIGEHGTYGVFDKLDYRQPLPAAARAT